MRTPSVVPGCTETNNRDQYLGSHWVSDWPIYCPCCILFATSSLQLYCDFSIFCTIAISRTPNYHKYLSPNKHTHYETSHSLQVEYHKVLSAWHTVICHCLLFTPSSNLNHAEETSLSKSINFSINIFELSCCTVYILAVMAAYIYIYIYRTQQVTQQSNLISV